MPISLIKVEPAIVLIVEDAVFVCLRGGFSLFTGSWSTCPPASSQGQGKSSNTVSYTSWECDGHYLVFVWYYDVSSVWPGSRLGFIQQLLFPVIPPVVFSASLCRLSRDPVSLLRSRRSKHLLHFEVWNIQGAKHLLQRSSKSTLAQSDTVFNLQHLDLLDLEFFLHHHIYLFFNKMLDLRGAAADFVARLPSARD